MNQQVKSVGDDPKSTVVAWIGSRGNFASMKMFLQITEDIDDLSNYLRISGLRFFCCIGRETRRCAAHLSPEILGVVHG